MTATPSRMVVVTGMGISCSSVNSQLSNSQLPRRNRSRHPTSNRAKSARQSAVATCELCLDESGRWECLGTWDLELGSCHRAASQLFGGNVKCRIGRRHPRVNRDLQQHFLHVARLELVGEAGAHVQPELLPAAQRRGGGDDQQPPRAMVEAGPRPDRAPREPGDQLLEVPGEVGGRRDAAIDVRVAERRAPDRQAGLDRPRPPSAAGSRTAPQ